MTCGKPYDVVSYVKGELAEAEGSTARVHIDQCVDCRIEADKVERVLGAVHRMDRIDPSPGFRMRVRDAFVAAHPGTERTAEPALSLWGRIKAQFDFMPAWGMSVTAHLTLLAVAAVLFLRPGVAPKREEPRRYAVSQHQPNVEPDMRPITARPEDARPGSDPSRYRPFSDKDRVDWKGARLSTFAAGRTQQKAALRASGGGEGTGENVKQALAWLAGKQLPDGHWLAQPHGGLREYEVGITGLAILAFLGEGHTHQSGDYIDVVARGLAYLRVRLTRSGMIESSPSHSLYNHGIAALALLEAYVMTGDPSLADAKYAVAFSLRAQNDKGGWDYMERGPETDTSVGAWQIHLLRLARESGTDEVVPSLVLAKDRIAEMTASDGLIGYRAQGDYPNDPYAVSAAGTFAYLMSSSVADSALLENYRRQLLRGLDAHECKASGGQKTNDLYFWYFGTLAAFQLGGETWEHWNGALRKPLAEAQQKDGSWPANFDRWSAHGGQVYTTAMGALILETYYRYPRLAR